MEELKNCPLCGGRANFYRFAHKNVIYCNKCGLKLEQSYGSKNDIYKAWNSRIKEEGAV